MTDAPKPLDIDTVQAFVLVADFASFTRAAEALDTGKALNVLNQYRELRA